MYLNNDSQPPKPDPSKTPEQQALDYQAWVLATLGTMLAKSFALPSQPLTIDLPSYHEKETPPDSRFN